MELEVQFAAASEFIDSCKRSLNMGKNGDYLVLEPEFSFKDGNEFHFQSERDLRRIGDMSEVEKTFVWVSKGNSRSGVSLNSYYDFGVIFWKANFFLF